MAVLGEARGDMGVVVLHFDQRQRIGAARARAPVWTTDIPDAGRRPARPAHDRTALRRARGSCDSRRRSRTSSRSPWCCDRIASPSLTRQNVDFSSPPIASKLRRRLEALRQHDGRRRVAPRPAQHAGAPGHDARHGIVDPVGDLAVVHQRVGRDAAKPFAGLVVGDHLRFVGEVAAGHHHRARHPSQHQTDAAAWSAA